MRTKATPFFRYVLVTLLACLGVLRVVFLGGLYGQTFIHTYSNGANVGLGAAIIVAPNGNLVAGGAIAGKASVGMMDQFGNPIWTRTFTSFTAEEQYVSSLAITPDGFIIGCGNTGLTAGAGTRRNGFVFKMDQNGNLLWHHGETHADDIFFDKIKPLDQSAYIVSGGHITSGTGVDLIVAKLDAATGNVIDVSARLDLNNVTHLDDPYGLAIAQNGDIYVCGRFYVGGNNMRPYLARFDQDLNLLSMTGHLAPLSDNVRQYATAIHPTTGGFAVLGFGDRMGTSANFTTSFYVVNAAGSMQWGKNYDLPGSTQELTYDFIENPTGYILFGKTSQNLFFAMQIDFQGNHIWTRTFASANGSSRIENYGQCVDVTNGNVAFAGIELGTPDKLVVGKIDFQGVVACASPVVVTPVVFTYSPFSTAIPYDGYAASLPMTFAATQQTTILPMPCSLLPNSVLGADTSFCQGGVVLDATQAGSFQYLWSTGATSPTITVNSPGTYAVTLTSGCCSIADTIGVSIGSQAVNLGQDQTLCANETVLLDAGVGNASYIWSTGATTQTITVSQAGTYSVTITDQGGCTAIDTVNVAVSNPTVDLGPDQVVCGGGSIVLDAANSGATFLWSTGATGQAIVVATAGIYTVTVTDAFGCQVSDSMLLQASALSVSLGPDTNLCAVTQFTLDAGAGYLGYQWSTGATTQQILVSSAGTFAVTVSDTLGCLASDTMLVSGDSIGVNLGPDSTLCENDMVFLDAGWTGSSHLWSTGDTGRVLMVTAPGTYSVIVVTPLGCFGNDTIELGLATAPPISLGEDQEHCGEDGVVLRSPITGFSYLWSTGATTEAIYVDSTGSYTLSVETTCGVVSDVVEVRLIKEANLFIPNVFTPNGDGFHDTYVIEGDILEGYVLEIYDRWGARLFRSYSIADSWDGMVGGAPGPETTYYYRLQFIGCDRKIYNRAGWVSLLR